MKTKNKAFTLIELLVVVVIIGVLSVLAVPVFSNYTAKAEDTKRLRFVHASNVILLATLSKQTDYPYDKIADGSSDTTLDDIRTILRNDDIIIPDDGTEDYGYWYFSAGNEYIVASCSQEIDGKILTMGTANSKDHIECLEANFYRIPTLKNGGWFDGGVNFKLTQ